MRLLATHNNFYISYCKCFNRIHFFKELGNLISSKKLSIISKFLSQNYNLLPSEVISTSLGTFIILFFPILIIFLQFNTFLAIIASIFIGYLGAYKIFNYPFDKFSQTQNTILQFSDLAFQDLILILNTTNSYFDAIHFISQSKYPIISNIFKDMIFAINFNGKSPESLIFEFIYSLPNGILKERLLNLMASKFHPNKLIEQMEFYAGEKKSEYIATTRQIESKLIIIIGVCLFFPILTALFISFLGTSANFFSLIIIPLFIFFSYQFKNRILKPHLELFGESALLGKDDLNKDNSILIELIHFLTYFGNELKQEVPQEIALLKAFESYSGPLKNSLKNSVIDIFYGNRSFKTGWNDLKTNFNDLQIHFLLNLIDRMLEKSSSETGNRILSIIQQLKANRELIQEREGIIQSQQFKTKFLIFIIAGILGLIAGLTPLLTQIFQVVSDQNYLINPNFWDSFPLAFSLFTMALYVSYFLPKLVKIYKPWRYSFWSGLIFVIFWYFVFNFLLPA